VIPHFKIEFDSLVTSLNQIVNNSAYSKHLLYLNRAGEFSLVKRSFFQKILAFIGFGTNVNRIVRKIAFLKGSVDKIDIDGKKDILSNKKVKSIFENICKKAHLSISNCTFISTLPPVENTWMDKLFKETDAKDKLLGEIVLPATHDSGASFINHHLTTTRGITTSTIDNAISGLINLQGILEDVILTQNLSILDQLKLGIRDFDFRVYRPLIKITDNAGTISYEKGDFYLGHGLCCVKLDDILAEMNQFLKDHPNDIVRIIVDNKKEHNATSDEAASFMISKLKLHPHLGDSKYHKNIERMIQDDERIVLYFERFETLTIDTKNKIWDGRSENYRAPYKNVSNVQEKKEILSKGLKEFPKNEFNRVLQLNFTLTPQISDVVGNVLGITNTNLRTLSEKMHKQLPGFLKENEMLLGRVKSIGFDFPTSELVQQVIDLNQKRVNALKK